MIYWTFFAQDDWTFILAATEKGLCFTGSESKDEEELFEWAKKRRKGVALQRDDGRLLPYVQQFKEFFEGKHDTINVPLDVEGTVFQQQVWRALQDIPFGEMRSYGEIAEAIKRPKAVRAVGAAIGANPVMISIPCHRVIGKDGSLTGFRGGLSMKQRLLHLEGRERL